ncbi:MAG: D-alanine--D-alanine ligase, partial [Actinomycetota bacterium]
MTAPDLGSPERIRLVVLFGGRSAEHDVSCVSARHVLAAVDTDRYEVEPIGITRDGTWVLAEAAQAALAAGVDAMPDHLTAAG